MVTKNMRKKKAAEAVFAALRAGSSLYAACEKAGLTTKAFYEFVAADSEEMREYYLALADYADMCMDNIKAITKDLKAGEIDNSTAKLLIETEKWLAQKACPQPFNEKATDKEEMNEAEPMEIVVKFV